MICETISGCSVPKVSLRVHFPPSVRSHAGQPHQHLNTLRESPQGLRQAEEEGRVLGPVQEGGDVLRQPRRV